MILAGLPAIIILDLEKDLVTTLPAPTIVPSSNVTPGRIIAFAPIQHPFFNINEFVVNEGAEKSWKLWLPEIIFAPEAMIQDP
jgi:hypothetical protein